MEEIQGVRDKLDNELKILEIQLDQILHDFVKFPVPLLRYVQDYAKPDFTDLVNQKKVWDGSFFHGFSTYRREFSIDRLFLYHEALISEKSAVWTVTTFKDYVFKAEIVKTISLFTRSIGNLCNKVYQDQTNGFVYWLTRFHETETSLNKFVQTTRMN